MPRRGGYDIVVTVTGPRQTLVTRRKERVLGIWINVDSRIFDNVPPISRCSPTGRSTTSPIAETLRRLQLGLDNFLLPQRIGADIADAVRDDPFRDAFLRLQDASTALSSR